MELALRADALPSGPGVYLFKTAAGRVLYVGKAQNLRARVRSYLGGATVARIPLVERSEDVDAT
jgi:excinuclease UvrABC nuclease subunit